MDKPLTQFEKNQVVQDEKDAEKVYQHSKKETGEYKPPPATYAETHSLPSGNEPKKDPIPPLPLVPVDSIPNVVEQIAVVLKDSGADTMQQAKALEKIKAILCI